MARRLPRNTNRSAPEITRWIRLPYSAINSSLALCSFCDICVDNKHLIGAQRYLPFLLVLLTSASLDHGITIISFSIDAKLVPMKIDQITEAIIGAAMEVHRTIGPGLLESAYTQCLCYELALRKIPFLLELPLPVRYKGVNLDCEYRLVSFGHSRGRHCGGRSQGTRPNS